VAATSAREGMGRQPSLEKRDSTLEVQARSPQERERSGNEEKFSPVIVLSLAGSGGLVAPLAHGRAEEHQPRLESNAVWSRKTTAWRKSWRRREGRRGAAVITPVGN